MARLPSVAALLLLAAAALAAVPPATAHESFTVSHYLVEYSWQSEPAVVGAPNAVRVAVTDTSGGGDGTPVTDASLAVDISYKGSTKGLGMETTDDTPGEYFGSLVPTKAGTYTIHITGTLGSTQVDKTADLEEAVAVKTQGFPSSATPTDQKANLALWVGGGAGGLGLVLAIVALFVAMGKPGQSGPARPAQQQPPARRP